MSEWVFYAVQVTTGQVINDLPLVGFSGGLAVDGGGTMSATMPLLHLTPDRRRVLLEVTTPGMFSVAALKDGVLMGEWIIWKRTRSNDQGGVKLDGAEIGSYLEHRVMHWLGWTNTDQITIAHFMATMGFQGESGVGGVAMTYTTPVMSGQLRDRGYQRADGDYGARLRELSEVDYGFDYLISSAWAVTLGVPGITRAFTTYYPRAGADLPLVFDMAGPGVSAGNVLVSGLEEDATTLANCTFAVGKTTDDVALLGIYSNPALNTLGYPWLERSRSWSTVERQPTIDGYAKALYDESQNPDVPIELSVLTDTYPRIGDYHLGDRVTLDMQPSTNFPDGYRQLVRIIAWEHQPPDSGPETLRLTVTREGQ